MNKKRSTLALLALIVTLIIILASILGSFFFVPPVSSNTGSGVQGTISGKVTDSSGIPIQEAQVSVAGLNVFTDDSGKYLLNVSSDVLKNVLELNANASGYQSDQVQLNPNGQNVSYDFSLNKLLPDQTVQISDSPYDLGYPGGVSGSRKILVEGDLPSASTLMTGLFMIKGATYTPYLRILVGETYNDGSWLPSGNSSVVEYVGGRINDTVTDYASSNETAFEVQPLSLLGGFIPTCKDTTGVIVGFPLQYYKDQQVFFSPREFSDPYNVTHVSYQFDTSTLKNASTVPDDRYLDISSQLLEQVKPLALNLTRNISSPFDQAKAIQDYLKENYKYSLNYPRAPVGVDPITWFLFNSTRGMCTQFSSAFVLLARSIGIPARVVGGYLIDPMATFQTVLDGQRHLYAEVLFQNMGWMTFDPTPPAIRRFVAINYPVYGSSVSGSSVFINGTVINPDNNSGPPFINSYSPFRLVLWNSSSGEFSFVNTTDLVGLFDVPITYTDSYGNSASSWTSFEFVPTPQNLVPTFTSITHCGNVGIKGSYFNVQGTVTASVVNYTGPQVYVGVDNLNVLIYLTKDKSQGGILCGQGTTANGGIFNITCYVDVSVNVGGYQVVAHAIGYGKYLDSLSDPEIKIMAETSLSASFPSEIITQRVIAVNGTLHETLGNQSVANQPVLISLGDQGRYIATDEQGFFATSFVAGLPGNYSYSATFQGSDLYLNTTQSGTIRIRSVTISPETPKVLIRSNTVSIAGHVYAEDLPLPSERLAVCLNGSQLGFATTDVDHGFFNLSYQVPSNHVLGSANVTYQLVQVPNTEYTQNVAILAQTFISCNTSKSLRAGDTLNFTVILKDDRQQPMASTPVNLDCMFKMGHTTSFQGVTDSQGEATYLAINMPADVAENVIYNATFAGDSFNAPSFVSGTLKVSGTFPFFTLLIFLGICLPVSAAGVATFLLRKRKPSKQNLVETVAVTSNSPAIILPVVISKRKTEISLVFPQISSQFPLVWGLDDPLLIELRLATFDESASPNLTLQINDGAEQSLKTSKGNAKTKHAFSIKGTYSLKAKFAGDDEWEAAMAEKNLRIVDYREEIVDLFNSFFRSAKTRFRSVSDEMTPRELQVALINQVDKTKLDALDRVVSIFELADYSLHEVDRKDYERIYQALKELES